jgi:hypothetical protein
MRTGTGVKWILTAALLASTAFAQELVLSSASRKTSPAVQRRVVLLQQTYVDGLAGLRQRYQEDRVRQIPILPPQPDLVIGMNGGYAAFRVRDFPLSFTKLLIPVSRHGVDVYPVTVAENALTRETLFFNTAHRLIGSLAPLRGYDPYAWLGVDYFTLSKTLEERAWDLALKDPARVTCTFLLLPYNKITEMAYATTVLADSKTVVTLDLTANSMATAESIIEDIVIRSVTPSSNGAVLDIAWPEGFTNRLEVATIASLGPTGWTPLPPLILTEGRESCIWTDTVSGASGSARFYTVGNIDYDSDGDVLSDARETKVYGTLPDSTDTDVDGLSDGFEVLTIQSNPLQYDTDGDTLGDGNEVYGRTAWNLSASNGCDWVEPGLNAQWVTQWEPGQVVNGQVDSGFSSMFSAPLIMGGLTGATFQVAVDGYILINSTNTAGAPSEGVNQSLPCPEFGPLIAPFWDDLRVSASTGIWVEVSGTGSGVRVVATWRDALVEAGSGLNEGLDVQCEYAAGAFIFRYRAAQGRLFPSDSSCTVGLQGGLPPGLARVAFNQSGWIAPNRTVKLTPAGTDPRVTDTDGDLWTDDVESMLGMSPSIADDPLADADADGMSAAQEWEYGTDPKSPDSDGDGFSDGEENLWQMDPLNPCDPDADEDNDGLLNWEEWAYGSNPLKADTDEDGAGDWLEADQGSDPTDLSDGGLAPADTMDVVVTLQAGDGQSAIAGNGNGASSSAPGSTILQIGNLRLRSRMTGGSVSIGRFRLPRGRSFDIIVYNLDGQVQQVPVLTTIEIDGLPPILIPNQPRWVCGPAVIDNPANAFGIRPVTVSRSKVAIATLRGYTLAIEGPNGERPPQHEWPLNESVSLTASLSPALEGHYDWTTDVESVQVQADGSNGTVQVGALVNVRVSFTPAGATAPMLSCTAPLKPLGHVCHWGDLVMTLSVEIPGNVNDSDADGTQDRLESPPPAGDPDLRAVTLSLDEGDMLDCCRNLYAGATLTLFRLTGGEKVRMWNAEGTAPFPMPFEEPLTAVPWSFLLEGVEFSTDLQDVKFQADVTFSQMPSTFRVWGTTVLHAQIIYPAGSADNNPARRTRFIDTENDYPYAYDWQAVCESPAGNASLCHPEGSVMTRGVYDYHWSLVPECGTLELIHTPTPFQFSPASVTGPYQDGVFRLEAYRNGAPTGVKDERIVRVYDDHLRRDMANFTPANLVPFDSQFGVMVGGTNSLGFVCHTSTSHGYNGMRNDYSWQNWTSATSVTFAAPGYDVPPFDSIERGDVIAYYRYGVLKHSQTCTGNGNETWGANNSPLIWDGSQYTNVNWTFCTSVAGGHYVQGKPVSDFPIEVKHLKKPH